MRVEGADRVRVLEPLFASAKTVRIWYDDEAQTNAWEIENEVGRYFSLVSPELSRGFSGEGQALERLATGEWQAALPHVTDALGWQSQIDPAQISEKTGMSEGAIEAALAVLGRTGDWPDTTRRAGAISIACCPSIWNESNNCSRD